MRRTVFPVVIGLLGFVGVGAALADVTIRGRVRYKDPTGNFVPLKKAWVEVEFDCYTPFCDKQTRTDDDGGYRVTMRNPYWVNSWEVNLDVQAEYSGKFQIYDSWWSAWPYYVTSRTITCTENTTCRLDFDVGGGDSTYHYGNARDNQAAFFAHQEMLDHYNWMVNHDPKASDFEEKEVFYPDEKSRYTSVVDYINLKPMGNKPIDFSYTVRHEYSHAMMADVYWTMPLGLDTIKYGFRDHSVHDETGAEYAFTEGWAEFLPTVTNPRSRGDKTGVYRKGNYDFEDSRAGWRKRIGRDARHWKVEGDVAGVLWDIYDPRGKEKTLIHYGDAGSADFRGDETWDDQLEDQNLTKIWTILKENGPDAILDDGDMWLDSFWYYWNRRHGDAHAMKAIFFNRGIHLDFVPQHPPAVSIHKVTYGKAGARWQMTVEVEVAEEDREDRDHIELQIWSRMPGQTWGRDVSPRITGDWNGRSALKTVRFERSSPFPPAMQFFVSANDDMEYAKATWVVPNRPKLDGLPDETIVNPLGEAEKMAERVKSAIPMRPVSRQADGTVVRGARPAARPATRPRDQWRTEPVAAVVKGYRNAWRGHDREIERACRRQAKIAYDIGRRLRTVDSASRPFIHQLCRPLPTAVPSVPEPAPLGRLRSLSESLAAGTPAGRLRLPAAEKAVMLEQLAAVERYEREVASSVEAAHRQLDSHRTRASGLIGSPTVRALDGAMRPRVEATLGGIARDGARTTGDAPRDTRTLQALQRTVRAVRTMIE